LHQEQWGMRNQHWDLLPLWILPPEASPCLIVRLRFGRELSVKNTFPFQSQIVPGKGSALRQRLPLVGSFAGWGGAKAGKTRFPWSWSLQIRGNPPLPMAPPRKSEPEHFLMEGTPVSVPEYYKFRKSNPKHALDTVLKSVYTELCLNPPYLRNLKGFYTGTAIKGFHAERRLSQPRPSSFNPGSQAKWKSPTLQWEAGKSKDQHVHTNPAGTDPASPILIWSQQHSVRLTSSYQQYTVDHRDA
ncbi:Uncharacterized protein PODLI_1B032480, partial [Podarcis lilfordi]